MVAAAFHHVPAKELGDLDHPIESDVLICSDHPAATDVDGSRSSRKIPNMRPLDAGELSLATPIESFTAVLLQLNVRYKTAGRGEVHRHPGVAVCPTVDDEPMRLYDTAAAGGRAVRARADRHDVHVRHHAVRRRRTSATPPSTSPTTSCSGGCVDLGHDDALRAQRHRRRRLDPRARPASSASTTSTSPRPRRPGSTTT